MYRIIVGFAILFSVLTSQAQDGSISGKVWDSKTNEPIIGANIVIQGTTLGAPSDIEGNFTISGIEPGTYSLSVTFITYKAKLIEGVVVKPGETTRLAVSLEEESQQLEDIIVEGKADRSSESALLAERKKSVLFVQPIGSQELSRKGVSNAEAAVVQVTGVSKQEGVKNVFVRGLSDRYNSTSLNGLPLPSEDPEYKNITLDFFSTNIINSIDVNKTFTSDQFGDVSGANINIESKNLFEDKELQVELSAGVNSQTMNQNFYRADGTNFLGTADPSIPITNLTQYDFEHSFNPVKVSIPLLNSSFGISGGRSFKIGSNELKAFAVASLQNNYFYKEGVVRQVNPVGGIRQDFSYIKSEYAASQLALANLSYDFGSNNSIAFNTMYIHDSKQSVGDYTGFSLNANDDITDPNAYKTFIRRQQQNSNDLLVNQLLTEISLSKKLSLSLAGSYNLVTGSEPDRRTNFYVFDGENYRVNTGSPAFNHRFYSSLQENELAARANLTYQFNTEKNNAISIGYNLRSTNRDFESTQFNHDFSGAQIVDKNNPDGLFNQANLDNGVFELETARGTNSAALNPFTYTGERLIHSGFVNIIYDLLPKLTVNAGLRTDLFNQNVTWDTNLGSGNNERNKTYFLPSLTLKYNASENDIVRFAASQTYTFPQFKEVAPFFYEDVNISSFGNPNLKPSENMNFDLRYERFFTSDELIALTGFYKQIKYPINRVQVASAANELSYVNTSSEAAQVFGAELEVRKGMVKGFNAKGSSTKVDVGVNLSYLYTNQKLEDVPWDNLVFQPTDEESSLEGASALLANADITYKHEGIEGNSFIATVLLNYYSDRIYSLGAPTGNNHIMEVGIPRLDFISSYGLGRHFSIDLRVKNILNPEFKLTKEVYPTPETTATEIISSFKKGITSSLGISYKF